MWHAWGIRYAHRIPVERQDARFQPPNYTAQKFRKPRLLVLFITRI